MIPISTYWGDYKENIAKILKSDHSPVIHRNNDIASRLFSVLKRKQRIRENGKILLTESDIEWRADIQRMYLEGVQNLPQWRMIDMHNIKLWEVAMREANKFNKLTGENYIPELWDYKHNHQLYIDIQKEISKEIQRLIKK